MKAPEAARQAQPRPDGVKGSVPRITDRQSPTKFCNAIRSGSGCSTDSAPGCGQGGDRAASLVTSPGAEIVLKVTLVFLFVEHTDLGYYTW